VAVLGPILKPRVYSSAGLMQTITVKLKPPDKLNFQDLENNFMFTVFWCCVLLLKPGGSCRLSLLPSTPGSPSSSSLLHCNFRWHMKGFFKYSDSIEPA
jgi:hypothetical protein